MKIYKNDLLKAVRLKTTTEFPCVEILDGNSIDNEYINTGDIFPAYAELNRDIGAIQIYFDLILVDSDGIVHANTTMCINDERIKFHNIGYIGG